MSNNAWASNGRDRQHSYNPPSEGPPTPSFNSQEVRDCLKNAIKNLTSEEVKASKYQPGAANNTRSGQAWASNPKNMSNGKDFYVELRKQVTAMQQGGERAGG
ncbi:hypothetical protein HO133_004445 [Letharia lupina]|uniref:Uncharacterized protein n=2 Tax=Letharia TaxID=112415 RepID=A0A8H6FKA5_9LECA|nr:uncharacterized protein HO133_004445 [Letharia lupina]XP_037169551.1 uncharacterized protein HO173_001893 [Letharia columbiana]KAF6230106.1 hypothetical protein HO133_004445 [Letharia lupina]KAF6240282.1 hypothetical protein HO173_001893 [Letharia columbiana]